MVIQYKGPIDVYSQVFDNVRPFQIGVGRVGFYCPENVFVVKKMA